MRMYRLETEIYQLQMRVERDAEYIESLNDRIEGLEKTLAAVVYENDELQGELAHAQLRIAELESRDE